MDLQYVGLVATPDRHGLVIVTLSSRGRPIVHAARSIMPPTIDELAATLFLRQLVTAGQLELEGDPENAFPILRDEVMAWLAEHAREPDRAELLGLFFEHHPRVAETFADEEILTERLAVWEQARRRFDKPVEHRVPELEQQMVDHPDDPAVALVYADVLQQHGDPLGELVACQVANNTRAAKKLLAEHGAFLFGPAEEYLRLFKVEYRHGLIRSITTARKQRIELEWGVVASWLLDRPIARFLERIVIGPLLGIDSELGVWSSVLAAPRVALRSITFKCHSTAGSLGLADLASAPRVQDVTIEAASVTAQWFAHPALRRLELTLHEGDGAVETIVDAKLPALETLAITALRITNAGQPWPRDAPSLRTLRLAIPNPRAILETLLAAPLLRQLAELEIADVDADAAQVFAGNAPRFAHLTKLSLPDHDLPAKTWQALVRAIPALKP